MRQESKGQGCSDVDGNWVGCGLHMRTSSFFSKRLSLPCVTGLWANYSLQTMSQDDDHDSGMAQQVKDLVQGAQLSPIMEQLAPLVSQLQAQQESGGGKFSNVSPLWG